MAMLLPASASAFEPLGGLGESGTAAGQLDAPYGVAVGPNGHIWVSEQGNSRLSEFLPNGAFVRAVGWDVAPGGGTEFETCTAASGCQAGVAGPGAGQVETYYALDIASTGEIVAPSEHNRIDIFSPTGEFLRAFGYDVVPGNTETGFEICTTQTGCQEGTAGGAAGQLDEPTGIEIGPGRTIWVTEYDSHRVAQFTFEGQFVKAFGADVIPGNAETGLEVCTSQTGCQEGDAGDGPGHLDGPFDIALANDGSLVVSDNDVARIHQFGADGTFVRASGYDVIPGNGETEFEICTAATDCQAGVFGVGAGQVDNPLGVERRPAGGVYVADGNAERVDVFTGDGGFDFAFGHDVDPAGGTGFELCTFATGCQVGAAGAEPGQLDFPQGLDVDCNQRLYVTSVDADRVQIFGEPTAAPPPCPFTIGKAKRNKRKGTAKLTVTVPAGGQVSLFGKTVKPKAATTIEASTLQLKIKAKGKAKRKLKERGKAKVRPKVTYTPPAGDAQLASKKILLKKKLRRR